MSVQLRLRVPVALSKISETSAAATNLNAVHLHQILPVVQKLLPY